MHRPGSIRRGSDPPGRTTPAIAPAVAPNSMSDPESVAALVASGIGISDAQDATVVQTEHGRVPKRPIRVPVTASQSLEPTAIPSRARPGNTNQHLRFYLKSRNPLYPGWRLRVRV
jgi:hypothetical protein